MNVAELFENGGLIKIIQTFNLLMLSMPRRHHKNDTCVVDAAYDHYF